MNKLTKSAKYNYLMLIICNSIILLVSIVLTAYFFSRESHPAIPQNAAANMSGFIGKIKSIPERRWESLIQRINNPKWHIFLTAQPKYPDNIIRNSSENNISHAFHTTKKIQISVFLKEGRWLNIQNTLQRAHNSLSTKIIVGTAISIFLLFIITNYWLVSRINQSLQMVLQSLRYARKQKMWMPIPITGDNDQQTIFKTINELQEKTNNLLTNRSHMLAAISHDLRTPLTRLKLRAEYLEENPQFDKVMTDIQEMEMMIAETLDYFSEYNSVTKKQKFDMIALIQAIIEEKQDKNHNISLSYDEKRLVYLGNINLLKRAFENVINNAIQHASEVEVSVHNSTNYINIIIEDNGQGINDDEIEKLGTPFFQTTNSETSGTGLGLMIAREVLILHGGSISFSNKKEGGLLVDIKIEVINEAS
ncbi:MAG: HAMP domain-containing sensor histidine kinase [Legionellaceae bacterium]|nr:HAMP domain-containing sensor histidine kinase [Legionellaceae bacterium]